MSEVELTARDRVLVVDDEDSLRRIYVRILEKVGFSVDACESASLAVERLNAGERYDAVVTDLVMAGMNGRDLSTWLQQHHPDLPVIVVSGELKPSDVPAAAQTIFKYLAKPVSPAELQGTVVEAVQASRARRAPAAS